MTENGSDVKDFTPEMDMPEMEPLRNEIQELAKKLRSMKQVSVCSDS
jgi:hypothetical protein